MQKKAFEFAVRQSKISSMPKKTPGKNLPARNRARTLESYKERALRLAAKNFVRNGSLPPRFNFVADCS